VCLRRILSLGRCQDFRIYTLVNCRCVYFLVVYSHINLSVHMLLIELISWVQRFSATRNSLKINSTVRQSAHQDDFCFIKITLNLCHCVGFLRVLKSSNNSTQKRVEHYTMGHKNTYSFVRQTGSRFEARW